MFTHYDQVFYHLLSPYFDKIPLFERKKFIADSRLGKWKRCLFAVLANLKSIFEKRAQAPRLRKWVMVDAINNYDTVSFLTDKASELDFLTFGNDKRLEPKGVRKVALQNRLVYIPKMIIYLLQNRATIKDRWDYFFVHFGMVEACQRFVAKAKPRSVLFTNDHTPLNRALMMACRTQGVTTAYLQHACVREDFGKLLVDHAFLEGQDSIDKYNLHGIDERTRIHLVGMPKFRSIRRQVPKPISVIGLAFNTTDLLDEVSAFVNQVIARTKLKVIVRPHPKDTRSFPFLNQVESSNPSQETPIEYLSRVDALIAGDSSIHLEAIMLNKPSYYFKFNDSAIFDLYGFEKNGLVRFYRNFEVWLEDVMSWNRSPSDVFKRASYYNSDLEWPEQGNTRYDVIYKTLFA